MIQELGAEHKAGDSPFEWIHSGEHVRAHEGSVFAAVSNQRWASDGLEIPCWNGELVRIAFEIDTHDREIITWVATHGGGISGETIRDMMLDG